MRKLGKLQEKITNDVVNICNCIEIIRKDGLVLYFTDHEKDLEIGEKIYLSNNSFNPTAFEQIIGLKDNNLEIHGILSHESINERDILNGLYDHAEVNLFKVDYLEPNLGQIKLANLRFGEVKITEQGYYVELSSFSNVLNGEIINNFSSTCRAEFCDIKCGLKKENYIIKGHVENVSSDLISFTTNLNKSASFFDLGVIKFLTGNNALKQMEVRSYINDEITLILPLNQKINIDDEFEILPGCDKNFSTCIAKYNNSINFRGEPHLPGLDKLLC